MCVPRQYSCLRPSGRCRVKRPFSTTFSNSLWADLPQVSLSPALPGNPIRKVPGETAFLHHLLEFVMGRPAPGVSLASPAQELHPEGAGRNGLSPPPSRIRYRPTCPRSFSRQPCPGTPSGRCRVKRPFSTTFSNSLWADLPQVSLSPALPGNPIRKVPGETAFLHHLLEFVIGRPAPGVSLASPIRDARPKGAGESAVYPSPS